MSFYANLFQRLIEWRGGNKRHFAGQGLIRVPVSDLEQLLNAYHLLDEQTHLEHSIGCQATHVVKITGGRPSERAGLANAILLGAIVAGYSLNDNVPTWDEGVEYLGLSPVKGSDDVRPEIETQRTQKPASQGNPFKGRNGVPSGPGSHGYYAGPRR